MCLVHMERIVKRQTTLNPQSEMNKVLFALAKTLHRTDRNTFFRRLKEFTLKYNDLLKEKTFNPKSGKWFYTHKTARSAWKSLLFFSEDLFTFENNEKEINKTTNSLEGHFAHVRDIINIHRGLSKRMKVKILYIIFRASTIAPSNKKIDEIL